MFILAVLFCRTSCFCETQQQKTSLQEIKASSGSIGYQHGQCLMMFLNNERPLASNTHYFNEDDGNFKLLFFLL